MVPFGGGGGRRQEDRRPKTQQEDRKESYQRKLHNDRENVGAAGIYGPGTAADLPRILFTCGKECVCNGTAAQEEVVEEITLIRGWEGERQKSAREAFAVRQNYFVCKRVFAEEEEADYEWGNYAVREIGIKGR